MSDKFYDFVENHRTLIKVGIVVIVLLVIVLVIRGVNMSRKAKEEAEQASREAEMQAQLPPIEDLTQPTEEPSEQAQPSETYDPSLGLHQDSGRVDYTGPTEEPESTEPPTPVVKTPRWDADVKVWGNSPMPDKAPNGDSFANYAKNAELKDFGAMPWGTKLTEDDFNATQKILVGEDQEPGAAEYGDILSYGTLMNNLDGYSDNTCIKFTKMLVMSSLSEDHVALLCSYSWYSAFGLEDVLLFFEDTTGTLSVSDFAQGDEVSAVVFRHNVKVDKVGKYRVLNVQYSNFEGLEVE